MTPTTPAEMKTEIARIRASLDGLIDGSGEDRELLRSLDRYFPSDDPRELVRAFAIVSGLSRKYSRGRSRPIRVARSASASASRGGMR